MNEAANPDQRIWFNTVRANSLTYHPIRPRPKSCHQPPNRKIPLTAGFWGAKEVLKVKAVLRAPLRVEHIAGGDHRRTLAFSNNDKFLTAFSSRLPGNAVKPPSVHSGDMRLFGADGRPHISHRGGTPPLHRGADPPADKDFSLVSRNSPCVDFGSNPG